MSIDVDFEPQVRESYGIFITYTYYSKSSYVYGQQILSFINYPDLRNKSEK